MFRECFLEKGEKNGKEKQYGSQQQRKQPSLSAKKKMWSELKRSTNIIGWGEPPFLERGIVRKKIYCPKQGGGKSHSSIGFAVTPKNPVHHKKKGTLH